MDAAGVRLYAVGSRHLSPVYADFPLYSGHHDRLAQLMDWWLGNRRTVQPRKISDWPVSGKGRHWIGVRPGRIAGRGGGLGLLLVPDFLLRRRTHSRVVGAS